MKKKKTILLIEDNRMDIELAMDAFSESGLDYYIHAAQSGQKALDYMDGRGKYRNREDFPLPDLILLDLKMPGLSGHDVLKQIKSQTILKRIPIIILTSSKEKEDLINCYENGANSYIVKPVSYEDFLKVIKNIDHYWLTMNIPAHEL